MMFFQYCLSYALKKIHKHCLIFKGTPFAIGQAGTHTKIFSDTWVLLLFYRRIRELNENNTKKFIEERKRCAVKHSRQVEALKKVHQDQTEKLLAENQKVMPVVRGQQR